AGCGGEPRSDTPVTVVFKHARMFGDDPVPRLVAAFEQRHPGVRVKTEALGSSSDEQHQFFVINLEGSLGRGRGPGFDVMMLDVIWVPEFARAGWLLDLTPSLAPGELDAHGDVLPDTARAADALARLRGWIADGISPSFVSAADEELTRRAFGDGRAIFLRNWFYAMDLFEEPGTPVRGKVGIAPLPGRLAPGPSPGSTGGSLLGVSRTTRHPEAAVALARFLASEEAQ